MPYRLRKTESIRVGVVRVAGEEIAWAANQLAHRKKRAEAIHEARKSIKKIRGLLRLVQPELGKVYLMENRTFRDVGRELSQIRDAQVMIEVFDGVSRKYQSESSNIRHGLERDKRGMEQSLDLGGTIKRVISALNAARGRLPGWPLESEGFAALAPGLEAGYRRGRRALRRAEKSDNPEIFHEFRKAVKEHWYHIRLLGSLWSEETKAREEDLKHLETWLGEDHNLVVLREKIEKQPETYSDRTEVTRFLVLTVDEQRELRQNSLSLGKRLYAEKASNFIKGIAALWELWQAHRDKKPAARRATKKAAVA